MRRLIVLAALLVVSVVSDRTASAAGPRGMVTPAARVFPMAPQRAMPMVPMSPMNARRMTPFFPRTPLVTRGAVPFAPRTPVFRSTPFTPMARFGSSRFLGPAFVPANGSFFVPARGFMGSGFINNGFMGSGFVNSGFFNGGFFGNRFIP